MIEIIQGLSLPENEITYTASRSGGPGGQNVNKVSSRVTLEFDLNRSTSLSEDQRTRIARRLASRINKDGVLRVVSQRTRSQEMNRADVLERFVAMLQAALRVERRRIKTRIPPASRDERITVKKKRTVIKQMRSKRDWDE